jgi:predicted DNA-binding transcriptional regulator AlpA
MALRKVEFAAQELGVSEQRGYELVRKVFFPPGIVTRLGVRQIRFNEEALRAWIAGWGAQTPKASNAAEASTLSWCGRFP